MRILGIETSCDETAASVVEDGRLLLSNVIASSVDLHKAYGGVVPEIAARSHIESIIPVVDEALKIAISDRSEIDAIAVTYGPGLLGSLLIGTLTARTMAIALNKPLFAVNHVEAHVYASFITDTKLPGYTLPRRQPEFPLLALIISGGHTQLVHFTDHFKYTVLGKTADDAVGEAFDKVAKILGLPYPGGPSVAKAAKSGNPQAFQLPTPKMSSPYDFSYSGLKTAVLRACQDLIGENYAFPSSKVPDRLSERQKADMAASFQSKAIRILIDGFKTAKDEYKPKSTVIAGGVAANQHLRQEVISRVDKDAIFPDIKLCTDNAAMIAALGYVMASSSRPSADPYTLEVIPNLAM